jgi:hypothetical protein
VRTANGRDCDLNHSAGPLGLPVSASMGCLAYQLRPVNMEDGMLAYLRITTIALLAMTAISSATVAQALAHEPIHYGWDGSVP